VKPVEGETNTWLEFYMHLDANNTSTRTESTIQRGNGNTYWLRYSRDDGQNLNTNIRSKPNLEGWTDGDWQQMRIRCHANEITTKATGVFGDFTAGMDLGTADGGTIGIESIAGSEEWIMGGGAGDHQAPYLAHPRSGTITLKEAEAWTLPWTFLAFDKIYYSYDTTNDVEEIQRGGISFRLKIYDTEAGTWGEWQNVGADGDASGISANPCDRVLMEITLNNHAETEEIYESYPGIKELAMTYTAGFTSATLQMDDLLALIKDEIDGDATIAAHPGFKTGTGSIICDGNYFPPMPAGWATVYLARGPTDRPSQGQGRDGAEARATHRISHNFQAIPCVVYETSDPAKKLMATNALEQLTTMVIEALSCNNLAGNLNRTQQMIIGDVTPGPHSIENNVYYSANTIDITVLVGSDKS